MSEMEKQERDLVEWLADMKEDEAFALAKKMLLEDRADPMRVLELCRNAMDIVGKRFERASTSCPSWCWPARCWRTSAPSPSR